MRPLPVLTAAAALAVLAVGCAAPDDASPADSAEPTAKVKSLEKDAAIADQLPADIKEAGVVRVASWVSFPPMEFFDTDNKTVLGFDADLG